MKEKVSHTLPPVFDQNSRVLILGTIPSPKSRETGFYYGHPQNRFWAVLAAIYQEPLMTTTEEKRGFLSRHRIALWDVLSSCEIRGASDSSISAPVPNDLRLILDHARIRGIFCTGSKSAALYQKYCYPVTKFPALVLPSTSPANCRMSLAALTEAYQLIREYTDAT